MDVPVTSVPAAETEGRPDRPIAFLRSARVVSLCTLLSRILGLLRDMLMARVFGAGLVMDAFVNAFLIPNLMRRLLGEGALSSAFISVLAGFKKKGDDRTTMAFMNAVVTFTAFLLLGVTFVGLLVILFFPTSIFFEGLEAAKMNLTLELSLILFPYVLFICLLALVTGILNSWGHFATPAIAPAVLNLFWMGGILLAVLLVSGDGTPGDVTPERVLRIKVVAGAIFVGGVFQLLMQIPALQRHGIRLRPSFSFRGSGLEGVLAMAAPIVIGLAPTQVNIFVDRVIAEEFVPGHGAVSFLFYGNRLMQFPLALVGIAMGTAVFPLLSELAARKESRALERTLHRAMRLTFFLAVPAAMGLLILGRPIVSLFFQHGEFDVAATSRTSSVVVAYAFGIPAFCGLQIVTRGLYAVGQPLIASRAAVIAIFLNLVLNLVLVAPLGESGLALSTSITSTLQLIWMWSRLSRIMKDDRATLQTTLRSLFLSVTASGVMGLVCLLLMDLVGEGEGFLLKALSLLFLMTIGLAVYGAVSLALPGDEARQVLRSLKRRPPGPS